MSAMISRATSSVSRLNDSRFSNVMRRVEAFAMPSFPPVRNFFVLRLFPRKREIFSPRMATLSVKHLVGDVSFLQDNANQELARFVLLVSRTRTSTRTIGFMIPMRDFGTVEATPINRPLSPSLSPSERQRAPERSAVGKPWETAHEPRSRRLESAHVFAFEAKD